MPKADVRRRRRGAERFVVRANLVDARLAEILVQTDRGAVARVVAIVELVDGRVERRVFYADRLVAEVDLRQPRC